MKHTYVFKEWNWKASGKYYDESQNCIDVYGEIEIEHHEENWIINGFMELKLDNPVRFYNKYIIEPIGYEKDFTFWSSVNPALGTLLGKFMIIGDTILSSYCSEDGQYSGTESLILVDSQSYKNRGFAFHNKNKLSSWEVEITKV
jgi:hypothetical protein